MERPYIIYHMTTTMDGKINGSFLELESVQPINDFYYQCHRQFKTDAFLCGRVTMQESFTGQALPDLSAWEGQAFPRKDHVAKSDAAFYAVALDPKGKLNWLSDHIADEDPGYDNAHVIEVLCETVPDAYLGFLREKGISHIFAGANSVDLPLAMSKLTSLFGIKSLLLEGGGITALGFAQADLIDEVSFLMAPVTGEPDAMGLFGPDDKDVPYAPEFAHREVLPAPGKAIWVRQWK